MRTLGLSFSAVVTSILLSSCSVSPKLTEMLPLQKVKDMLPLSKSSSASNIHCSVPGREASYDGKSLTLHDAQRGLRIGFTGNLKPIYAQQAIDEFMRFGNAGNAVSRLSKAKSPTEFYIRHDNGDGNINNDPYGLYHMPSNASTGTLTFADANGQGLPSQFDVPFTKALSAIVNNMSPYLNPDGAGSVPFNASVQPAVRDTQIIPTHVTPTVEFIPRQPAPEFP